MSLESWDTQGLSLIHQLINAFSEDLFYLSNRAEQARLLMNKKKSYRSHIERGPVAPLRINPRFLGSSPGARTPCFVRWPGSKQRGGILALEGREEAGSGSLVRILPSLWAKMTEQWRVGAPFSPHHPCLSRALEPPTSSQIS